MTLSRYAQLTAAMTFLLLIAGGLVTSTDSGLSVPDWPLSYGGLFPPMVGGIAYEHSHRLIAGAVALLITGLAVWLKRREPRRWVRRLGTAAFFAVLAQAVLGGLTVLLLLPPPVSIAHACLGQTVFCLVVSIALVTSPGWQAATQPAVDDRRLRVGCLALLGALGVQLLLGAVIRHSGLGVSAHVVGAMVVVALASAVLVRLVQLGSPRSLFALGVGIVALIAAQAGLGVLVLVSGQQPLIATAHVATGALILASTCVLTWHACRAVSPTSAAVGIGPVPS